ncbi:MAG: MBL fold metallo-hydrolase [Ignavibacteriae bacterium]|nr:MBL fold metallo-hydrolase [Ignavibacteriota bacterium]
MIYFLFAIVVIVVSIILFFRLKSFGGELKGERLARVLQSPNYRNGVFHYPVKTELMSGAGNYFSVMKQFLKKDPNKQPNSPLPTIKTDLKTLPMNETSLVWFGHSSYFLQVNDFKMLVDPVLSERISPVQFAGTKSYPGTRIYSSSDIPELDCLLLTHDHYDHLDYQTVVDLNPKVKKIYTSLGVGSHLEHWGIEASKIHEFDWWDTQTVTSDIQLTATPARHFSGRRLTNRNQTLWSSFVLTTPNHRIFIGGDSGYGEHFKKIGEKFGPFDLVIMETGQYNVQWANIHSMPEEAVQASVDLKGKVMLPVHWGKFTLALHPWTEPIERVLAKAKELEVTVTTPLIGERLILDTVYPNSRWWVS